MSGGFDGRLSERNGGTGSLVLVGAAADVVAEAVAVVCGFDRKTIIANLEIKNVINCGYLAFAIIKFILVISRACFERDASLSRIVHDFVASFFA